MRPARRLTLAAPPPDPFGERRPAPLRERLQLLGASFEFETGSAQLARIVREAYSGLPSQRLRATVPHCRVSLVLSPRGRTPRRRAGEPPAVRPLAGAGVLCGATEQASFVALTVPQRAALIVVAHDLLRYSYHVRYELLEFAVYVLAARVQSLLPLHAACVGRDGEGILIVGPSGAGKSTLMLHCLLEGLEFLAEDSVLLRPRGMLATGVANFLHLRPDALRFLDRAERADVLRNSSVIRRRSGIEKLEIDLRRAPYRLARTPLGIRAVVFLSPRTAHERALLTRLRAADVLRRMAAHQRYAAQQPGWHEFTKRLTRLPAYELRRAPHPRAAVEALRGMLSASSSR